MQTVLQCKRLELQQLIVSLIERIDCMICDCHTLRGNVTAKSKIYSSFLYRFKYYFCCLLTWIIFYETSIGLTNQAYGCRYSSWFKKWQWTVRYISILEIISNQASDTNRVFLLLALGTFHSIFFLHTPQQSPHPPVPPAIQRGCTSRKSEFARWGVNPPGGGGGKKVGHLPYCIDLWRLASKV